MTAGVRSPGKFPEVQRGDDLRDWWEEEEGLGQPRLATNPESLSDSLTPDPIPSTH